MSESLTVEPGLSLSVTSYTKSQRTNSSWIAAIS